VAYVGSEACADCHSLIAESFSAHGMARTFAPMDSASSVADWSTDQVVVDAKTGLRYQPYRDGSRFFIRETLLDDSEQNGFLRMLPLEWYTDEKRWDFAPVFESENQRFSRRINARCVSCHNAPVKFESEQAARLSLPLPSGISCERCHGPGELHVKARAAGYDPGSGADTTIVNSAHLTAARQLDVCAQCHLQGDAEVLRRGKSQLSFRPGDRLADHRAVFVSRGSSADTANFGFVRHVERLVLSRCFTAGGGTMTCTTCHDPHRSSTTVAAAAWDAACAKCHSVEACTLPAMEKHGETCVACHMRRSEPYDVRHVTITDHWIRRRITPPARNPSSRFRPDPQAPLEPFALPGERREATAENLELLAVGSADLGLREETRTALIAALKSSAGRKGARVNPPRARDAELARAALLAQDPRARLAGAKLLAAGGDSVAARAVLEEAVADERNDPRLAGELARMEAMMGDAQGAFARMGEAMGRDPNDPEPFRLLAELAVGAGQLRPAAERYSRALALDPGDATLQLGLGRVLLRNGDTDRAAAAFSRAAAELPFSAEAHGSLGFALAAMQRHRPAIAAYRRALALDPGDADLQFNFGNALAAAGDGEAAEAAYREAIRLEPDHYRAHGNLGFLLRDRGDATGARLEFERVLEIRPGDEHARRALDDLAR
jgi:tetratricopeptide (TPR) repeat protein